MAQGIGIKSTTVNPDPGTVGIIKKNAELVAESIHRIINTRPGEKPRDPRFGSRIKELLFEQNDLIVATLGAHHVATAIQQFEPRVTVETINTTTDTNNHSLTIEVLFRLLEDPTTLFRTVTIIT